MVLNLNEKTAGGKNQKVLCKVKAPVRMAYLFLYSHYATEGYIRSSCRV